VSTRMEMLSEVDIRNEGDSTTHSGIRTYGGYVHPATHADHMREACGFLPRTCDGFAPEAPLEGLTGDATRARRQEPHTEESLTQERASHRKPHNLLSAPLGELRV